MEKNTLPIDAARRSFAIPAVRLGLTIVLLWAGLCFVFEKRHSVQAQAAPRYAIATFSAGTRPVAAKIADLDGDGLKDIAVADSAGSLQFFFNRGGGSFDRSSISGAASLGPSPIDLDVADLNGDGRPDIAVASANQQGSVSVLLNQGNRSFSPAVTYSSTCAVASGIVIGDVDQDGDNDIVEIGQCSRAAVMLNNGSGAFTLRGLFGSGAGSRSIALPDLNGDGFKDIAYVNNGNADITVSFNNGSSSFGSAWRYFAWDLPDDLVIGDFDNDGDIDIAVANSYYSIIFVLLNGGDG